ncbi:MAG: hypothetical protein IT440_06740 [Phycisphaeraceae bacterium]|nr:hypothetical protein [Phycisphaeraceae bacterium]
MRAKTIILGLVQLLVVLAIAYGGWLWFFCRFYVPPEYMAIITSKSGTELSPGRLLAGPGEKGVRADVLGEGRHFLNPVIFEHEIRPLIVVPPGKVGIVTSKVGTELPTGEFLADEGQKGIRRHVLGPGKYRMNPYGYEVDLVDAVSIPIGYVGVVTSLSGTPVAEDQFAGPGQKGVCANVLQPGLYYINPKQHKVDVLEVGVNQVSLLGKIGSEVVTKGVMFSANQALDEQTSNVFRERLEKRDQYVQQQLRDVKEQSQAVELQKRFLNQKAAAPAAKPARVAGKPMPQAAPQQADVSPSFVLTQFVEFPSRDGFQISLDMTVEFELMAKDLSRIYRDYGDLTLVVDNIIMPQILSISRLKGSAFRAVDFIVGEGREKFQTDLTEALKATLAGKKIVIHNALIRHVNVPDQILSPIQAASAAREQDLTNKERQNTARKQAELNTEQSMIDQSRETVMQETSKLKAEIQAEQEKQVAEIQAETLKQVAQIEQEIAATKAEKARTLGKADADVVTMVEGERAKGFELKVQAFGDPAAYGLWEMAKKLNPSMKVNIIHAGEGTLWTDLDNATTGNLGGAAILKNPDKSGDKAK